MNEKQLTTEGESASVCKKVDWLIDMEKITYLIKHSDQRIFVSWNR